MNWDARLKRAEKQGVFLDADKDLAGEWSSCAVGENKGEYRTNSINKYTADRPRAGQLWKLGMDFQWAVAYDKVSEARALYDRIQAWFKRYGRKG